MKRFDIAQARTGGVMVESEDGDYVLHDEVAHRGYVLFGAGAYLLTICKGDEERGPELVAHLATDEEKVGRTVGDLGDVVPDKEIPLERVAVRLQFASEAGLAALEQQLRMLREAHFPSAPAAVDALALLREVHDVLESTTDSDLDYFEDEEEEREAVPVQYAARKLFQAIQLLEATPGSKGAAA